MVCIQLLYVSLRDIAIKKPGKIGVSAGFLIIGEVPYFLYLAARAAASRSLLKASRILRRLCSLGFS
jgi:hypothetical protein